MAGRGGALTPLGFLRTLWRALREFLAEGGIDRSSILAYYSIFSTFFLLIFFSYLFAGLAGEPDAALQNVYPFSPEFFRDIAPVFFQQTAALSARIGHLSLYGLGFFLFLGVLIFKKMVQFINDMFRIRAGRVFFARRAKEFGLLLIVLLLVIASFLVTGLSSTVAAIVSQDVAARGPIDPALVRAIDSFLVRYAMPFLITFLFFTILFKWIPEKRVAAVPALVSALFAALLWETVKRAYAYYLVNVSLLRRVQDPIVAIIVFGFWMEITMGIMLYGAKMTYLLDKEAHA
jgi:membrane protein